MTMPRTLARPQFTAQTAIKKYPGSRSNAYPHRGQPSNGMNQSTTRRMESARGKMGVRPHTGQSSRVARARYAPTLATICASFTKGDHDFRRPGRQTVDLFLSHPKEPPNVSNSEQARPAVSRP